MNHQNKPSRRHILLGFATLSAAHGNDTNEPKSTLRGRFQIPGIVTTGQGKKIKLTGDEPTMLVLNDPRLNGLDFEAVGEFQGPGNKVGAFVINPIHLRAMWIYKNNQRLMVTYWCDICYIRTYSPGQCWCCQEDTRFDPKDPNSKDPTP